MKKFIKSLLAMMVAAILLGCFPVIAQETFDMENNVAICPKEAFASLLNAYAEFERSGFTVFDDLLIGHSAIVVWRYAIGLTPSGEASPPLIYAFYDINDDGEPKLFVGTLEMDGIQITGVYILQNGVPVSISMELEDAVHRFASLTWEPMRYRPAPIVPTAPGFGDYLFGVFPVNTQETPPRSVRIFYTNTDSIDIFPREVRVFSVEDLEKYIEMYHVQNQPLYERGGIASIREKYDEAFFSNYFLILYHLDSRRSNATARQITFSEHREMMFFDHTGDAIFAPMDNFTQEIVIIEADRRLLDSHLFSVVDGSLFCIDVLPIYQPSNVTVIKIDGTPITFPSQQPIVIGDTDSNSTFVPACAFFKALGFDMERDEILQQATFTKGDDTIIVTAGSDVFIVNGERYEFCGATFMYAIGADGYIMLPNLARGELLWSMGLYRGEWDASTRILNIATVQPISVIINGEPVVFHGQAPVIVDGRVLVPVQGVFSRFFHELRDADKVTEILTAAVEEIESYYLVIIVGNDYFTVVSNSGRDNVALDVPAQFINDVFMIPLRLPLESVGFSVDWDEATRTVNIWGNWN